MVNVIAWIDLLGALAFGLAFYYAVLNYRYTESFTSYWMVFATASFIGFFWASMTALEWFGVFPDIIDQMVGSVAVASTTAFAITALDTIFLPFKRKK